MMLIVPMIFYNRPLETQS